MAGEAIVGGPYPWVSDQGDGTYRNPIIIADLSDPDVLRVGDDYYLVASSFNCTPALPILHSRDLVNWTIVGHALSNLPHPRFTAVQAGGGVWAPALREHASKYYLFFPMPDDGIYVLVAATPAGPWSAPRLLVAGKGLIDPCPFWDEDGRAYLVHAYAKSRSGIKSKLRLRPMAPDASRLLGDGAIVFDGTTRQPTLEGPKLYKRNGWYLILAPAGGVSTGWQVALRARDIWGPYQDRVVLEQGGSPVNGPHQGALVDTPDGHQWWFLHFQDLGVYGRVLHLNPVTWVDDWPLMGVAVPGMGTAAGVRQPVLRYRKPATQSAPIAVPQTSDDFASTRLGPQWQWFANHDNAWYSLTERSGFLRLFPQLVPAGGLANAPNLLLQKFPARSFTVETTMDLTTGAPGTHAGLIVIGKTHAELVVERTPESDRPSRRLMRVTLFIDQHSVQSGLCPMGPVRLKVVVADGGLCQFSFGPPGGWMLAMKVTFHAQAGVWIGAKVGVFAVAPVGAVGSGPADFSDFRFGPPEVIDALP